MLLAAILRVHSHLHRILLDLPSMVGVAAEVPQAADAVVQGRPGWTPRILGRLERAKRAVVEAGA
jgi:hypothetical protein